MNFISLFNHKMLKREWDRVRETDAADVSRGQFG
jgi:hypothetical protein